VNIALVLPDFEPYEAASGALAIIVRQLALELPQHAQGATVVGPAPSATWEHGTAARLVPAVPRLRRVLDRAAGGVRSGSGPAARYRRAVAERVAGCDRLVVMNDLDLAASLRRSTGTATWCFAQNEIEPHESTDEDVRRLDGLLACSPYIRHWLMERYRVDDAFVAVVPNGVDLELFGPAEVGPDDRDADQVTGADDASPPIGGVFVGRIDPNKGILELLEATTRVRRDGVGFALTVAGPIAPWGLTPDEATSFAPKFEAAVSLAGATYLGSITREATASLMAGADVVFVPSVSQEPFGLTAVEALASGVAVVLSDRGALPWIGGDAALIVEPRSDALAGAIAELAGDPTRRSDLAARARDRAREFTWTRSAAALVVALT